ncbi:hypothetical protein QBC37DRAFT_374921 [Rhypophila decipiens]|uniref:Uncharacterized protein n=1 Tax=Rhypophila decipiens TaxID=261697 RepID=A0AAN7B6C1_9PEZI|nr:hypothetical protein QBC37DRAFT_374921 [Rhypophila decipiens]
MQLTAIIASTIIALAPVGTQAWANDGRGVWVANNSWHTIRGVRVHEACTRMNDANTILRDVPCGYWLDGAGTIINGYCRLSGGSVACI